MGINTWPAEERPREKLLERGASALTDAELLAIFLRTGVRGRSAIDLARELLTRHNGLRALLATDVASFSQVKGLGTAKYCQLQAVLELSRRYLREDLQRGEGFTQPEQVRAYLTAQLAGYPHEVFACLFLDSQHRLLHYEALFRGTLDSASVHPREVVKRALAHNAAAVILAHNHPSGCNQPSTADLRLTERLTAALALIDVRVLDHIIVGAGAALSCAERGLM
jgi:DNA repair protein RadC